jgi:UDPglucose--hexose-1-phosphate uridylyltransferase
VVFAPERAARPSEYGRLHGDHEQSTCPFCPGNESFTPPSILEVPGEGGRWVVRVFPNKYPALRVENPTERRAEGLHDWVSGAGAHEVIVETPNHNDDLGARSAGLAYALMWAYRERIRDLSRDVRLRYISVFRNRGALAGATLSHPHSQLVALPLVPPQVRRELEVSAQHLRAHGRCLTCDTLAQELSDQRRVVDGDEHFVAYCPFASRSPFELCIAPRHHEPHFASIDNARLERLAVMVQTLVRRLSRALGSPDYNLWLHTAPNGVPGPTPLDPVEPGVGAFHWRIAIVPRLGQLAGFEWSTGMFINTTLPEDAAAYLRALPA